MRRVHREHFIPHCPLVFFAKRLLRSSRGGAIDYPRTEFWGMLPLDRNLETSAGGRLKVASSCKLAAAQPLHEQGLQFRVQNVINDEKE